MCVLRKLLEKPLVIPGVYDALGARIARRAGFEAMFQTGYGTSASLLGMPDYGFVGAAETVDNARRICRAAGVPVIVDADTGYGNALSVWKITKELGDAGAAGMFLEDQRWPKRCGHMKGKEVIPQEEYTEKLGAALDARQDEDFVVVARTDARATEGLDAAIERSRQNLKTGADAVFIEAPGSLEEMERIGREIKAPLVANMIEGGATPVSPAERLADMGFGIILYPLSALYASAFAMAGVLDELKRSGGTSGCADRLVTFDQFNEMVGLDEFRDMEEKFSAKRKN
ncbi:MAG: oxaloacetate decarboxylase [Nitrosopumilus sp. H8]|nr:MAG: oxaloacetate decarboxylase [Nitrosopumilus sp. H13]RNJ78442.1 MAG: oxaloacetate decarboxylase [Nitrosopumilus sp. H8]